MKKQQKAISFITNENKVLNFQLKQSFKDRIVSNIKIQCMNNSTDF